MPGFAHNLHTVGEGSPVKIKMDTTSKIENHGVPCLFVGYSLTHTSGCYRMYDPKTHRVCISQDVLWLHHMFYQKTHTVEELKTDSISVGNWSRNPQGVLWLIEVGEGITEATKQGPEETPMTVDDPTNNQEGLEVQPVGEHKEQQVEPVPTATTVTAAGRASMPQHAEIKEIGEAAHTAAEQNYYFVIGKLIKEQEHGCAGMGIGSGSENTNELKVMGYEEVMACLDKSDC